MPEISMSSEAPCLSKLRERIHSFLIWLMVSANSPWHSLACGSVPSSPCLGGSSPSSSLLCCFHVSLSPPRLLLMQGRYLGSIMLDKLLCSRFFVEAYLLPNSIGLFSYVRLFHFRARKWDYLQDHHLAHRGRFHQLRHGNGNECGDLECLKWRWRLGSMNVSGYLRYVARGKKSKDRLLCKVVDDAMPPLHYVSNSAQMVV